MYTIPVTGRYKVYFQANIISTAANQVLAGYLRQNSTNVASAYSNLSNVTGNYCWLQIEDTLNCVAGDTISNMLWVNATAVNLQTGGGASYMDIDLLGAGVGPTGAVGPTGPGGTLTDSGWHYIDTPGEPQMSGTPYDGAGQSWCGGRYRRDAAGCVFLEGLINVSANGVVFTLPPGFRPAYELRFTPYGNGNPAFVQVRANGDVVVTLPAAPPNYFSLNNVTFMAEDYQNVNWVYPTVGGGWSNFGQGTAPCRYFLDSAGDLHLSGTITGGPIGPASGAIFTLPSNLIPDFQTTYTTACAPGTGGACARVDVNGSGGGNAYPGVVNAAGYASGGTNAWTSLDGIVLPNIGGYWWTPALQNSWVAYGGAWAPGQWCTNKNGVLSTRGLIKSGVTTVATVLWAASSLPFTPPWRVLTNQWAAGGVARVDWYQDGSCAFVGFTAGGTNGYMSMNSRWFVEAEGPGVIQAGATGPTGATGPAGASSPLLMSVQTLTAPTVAASPYTITHNLGTTNVLVQMYDAVTQRQVQAQVAALNTNQIQVSVATNMPNNVNVIIMGATASPVPLFPADLATKAYVDSRTPNLPGAISSGSGIQTFTDVLGDVWVAANGVSNGIWKRASNAIHSRVYRNAAWTAATSMATVVFDTATKDDYGSWNLTNGTFAVPVGGLYHFATMVSVSSQAAQTWFAIAVTRGGSTISQVNDSRASQGSWLFPTQLEDTALLSAGDQIGVSFQSSTALGGRTGTATYIAMDYVGTG